MLFIFFCCSVFYQTWPHGVAVDPRITDRRRWRNGPNVFFYWNIQITTCISCYITLVASFFFSSSIKNIPSSPEGSASSVIVRRQERPHPGTEHPVQRPVSIWLSSWDYSGEIDTQLLNYSIILILYINKGKKVRKVNKCWRLRVVFSIGTGWSVSSLSNQQFSNYTVHFEF